MKWQDRQLWLKGKIMGDYSLKSFVETINLHPVARWKPIGIEMVGFNQSRTSDNSDDFYSHQQAMAAEDAGIDEEIAEEADEEAMVPGYTSEGSIGFEAGDKVKIGFDFYGRVAVNGQNKFAMSGGPRFSMSIDKYYGAFLAGSRTDGTLNPDDVLPESSARFSLEGGAELGRRSDGLIPSFSVGALWRADDQKLASTYLLLGYDW